MSLIISLFITLNGNEMDQIVHNSIACNCNQVGGIAVRYIHTFNFSCFLMNRVYKGRSLFIATATVIPMLCTKFP